MYIPAYTPIKAHTCNKTVGVNAMVALLGYSIVAVVSEQAVV